MRCPHCDTENESNAIFCKNCNAWILGTIYEEAPETEPQPEAVEVKLAPEKKRKWQLAVAAILTAVLIIGVILLWPKSPGLPETSGPLLNNGTVPSTTTLPPTTREPVLTWPAGTIEPMPMPPADLVELPNYTTSQGAITTAVNNGNMYFIANAYAIETSIPDDPLWYTRFSTDLSGKNGVYLAEDGDLYCILGTGASLLAKGVQNYRLSAGGTSIVYTKADDSMTVFGSKSVYAINNIQTDSYCISPNGEYVAFVTYQPLEGNKPYALTIQTQADSKRFRIFDNAAQVLAVSNDGNTVYVLEGDSLLAVDGRGIATEIGVCSAGDSFDYALMKDIRYLSSDHNQLLYYQPDGTYLSENGAPGRKLSDRLLEPVRPEGTSLQVGGYAITFPADTMLGVVYASRVASGLSSSSSTVSLFQTDLLFVDSSGNATLLEENVADCQVVTNGTSLFYSTTSKHLYAVDLLTGNKQEISSNAGEFTVTQDGKYMYYIMEDKLMRKSTDILSSIYIGEYPNAELYIAKNDVLCVWASNTLLVFDKSGVKLRTLTDVDGCELSSNGILYFTMPDGIYCINDHASIQMILRYTEDITVPDVDEYIEPIENEG